MAKSIMGNRPKQTDSEPKKPALTRKPNQKADEKQRRDWKEIKGKRVQVKYKAFRLPLDFIKELNIYSVTNETPLENIVYDALTEYMEKHN